MATMTEHTLRGLSALGFHRLAYTQWMPEGGLPGRTIVCCHGLTRNGRDFDVLAADLADSLDARVVCPDVVGRGKSGTLANPDLYGYPQYLADMAALIARLDVESLDWVGTSMGGLIGMILAAQGDTPITRLVVNDVGPLVPKVALERIGTYVGTNPVFRTVDEVQRYLSLVYAPFGDLTEAQWRHLAEHGYWTRPDGTLGLAYDTGIARAFQTQPITDVDLWPVWGMIRSPVLAIRGLQSDLLTAEIAQAMTERGPKATLFEVADAGHAPALMDPAQLAAVRDFLR
ncbi:pimeloyl-ACP methyl ester carboxylesterase [Nitrospirillum bahiense]|uniref:Pimeloyl-ACP methyl ester carboxylesterase n=2 Tax=Nitrospirillum amazonense TaxID=28077 RepID=A0A560GAP3_9PROT|nr:pimeloyl-ACP methyl ester carboxylesterase [Nitrospirillum amazonense]